MKFYYDGKLVRTSANHVYACGIYNKETGKMRSCHSTREIAESQLRSFVNEPLRWVENDERAIQAIKSGKKSYWVQIGNRGCYEPLGRRNTVEGWELCIEDNKLQHEYRKNNYCVVELEAR